MSDTTPSWGPPPGPTPPGSTPGDAPTQPAEPASPPTQVGPTAPGGPPGPPPAPGPGAPGGGRKGGIPAPAFIVVLVLLVAALAFGIVSFLGKNSEADDKDEAREQLGQTRAELRSARDEIASLENELSGSQETGQALSELLGQAASAADDLKACGDSSRTFISDFIDAVPGIIGSGEVPTALSDSAAEVDDLCATADGSYEELIDIFNEINQ